MDPIDHNPADESFDSVEYPGAPKLAVEPSPADIDRFNKSINLFRDGTFTIGDMFYQDPSDRNGAILARPDSSEQMQRLVSELFDADIIIAFNPAKYWMVSLYGKKHINRVFAYQDVSKDNGDPLRLVSISCSDDEFRLVSSLVDRIKNGVEYDPTSSPFSG